MTRFHGRIAKQWQKDIRESALFIVAIVVQKAKKSIRQQIAGECSSEKHTTQKSEVGETGDWWTHDEGMIGRYNAGGKVRPVLVFNNGAVDRWIVTIEKAGERAISIRLLKLAYCFRFDLANAFAGNRENLTDLFQRV